MIGNTRRAGFTLVEAVVAAAVSGVLIVSVVGTFVTFQKIQNSSSQELQLQSVARQFINIVTEQLRTGYIDYDFYPGVPSSYPTYLATRTPEGDQTVVQFYNPGSGVRAYICRAAFDDSCSLGTNPEIDADWSRIHTTDVYFLYGQIDVQPDQPQFYNTTTSDEPQLITMRIQLVTAVDASTEQTELIQTTLTPRVYAR